GDNHFQVQKSTTRNSTCTQVASLETQDRVEEIARMLGGLKISEQTRAHDREMLAGSRKLKVKS
ncbi:MAG: DNA repair protein RecN, partial [Gammaproteobacteria bacterium]|nr:DNA repair protein RecN [Gammaproteobacteria bacterium]